MINQEQKDMWEEIKETWKTSSQGEKINFQTSQLLTDLKGMVSQFEKDSIKSDLAQIKTSWDQAKGMVSQFEKDSINKDIAGITASLKKIVDKLRGKK